MCGISGIIYQDQGYLNKDLCHFIHQTMHHRGPDGFGWVSYNGNELEAGTEIRSFEHQKMLIFHSRLAVIDLTQSGHQPMFSSDNRYIISYNGEIYNYLELKMELESHGVTFKTKTDTEVLLNGYMYWGLEFLKKCEGMFAFALFDRFEKKMLLVRDFFGIKPLFYVLTSDFLIFASEIKTLLKFPGVPRQANPQRLYDYLRHGITDYGEDSMLSAIKQLPPAHYTIVDVANFTMSNPIQYWKISPEITTSHNYLQRRNTVKEMFLENIDKHLRSDVNIGITLSGGVDSSSIVSAIKHMHPNFAINTFSFIAKNSKFNEEKWIDIVNAKYNTNAHKIIVNTHELPNDLDELIKIQDEPFGGTSIFAQYCLYKFAKNHNIKVMLDGQGADEILGGYHSLLPKRVTSFLRNKSFLKPINYILEAIKNPGVDNKQFLFALIESMLHPKAIHLTRRLLGDDYSRAYLNISWFKERGIVPHLLRHTSEKEALKEMMKRSIEDQGLAYLLRYVDKNSMAFSIESRVPFLTPKFVNFLFSLPEEFIIDNKLITKAIFKDAMKNIVPHEILQRKDKIGFATPENEWIVSIKPWVDKTLNELNTLCPKTGPIDFYKVKKEWKEICDGQRHYSQHLWRILNLIKWTSLNEVTF